MKRKINYYKADQNSKTTQEMDITPAYIRGKRTQIKKKINQRTKIYVKIKMEDEGKNKSKVGYLIYRLQIWRT